MYTIGSDWFGDLTAITPCGMYWLADRLRALGYDAWACSTCVEVDRPVEGRHWERLLRRIPREYTAYSYDPKAWLEEQIQPPRRPRRHRRRAIRHALQLVRAISDGSGRVCWWMLTDSDMRPKIERMLGRIARIDGHIGETLADMLSANMEDPLEPAA